MEKILRLKWWLLPLYIGLLFAASLALGQVFLNGSYEQPQLVSADATPTSTPATLAPEESTPSPTPAAPPVTQTRSVSPTSDRSGHTANNASRACSGQVFQKPEPLNTAALPEGITVRQEPAQTYTIMGATLDQLRFSIQSCGVRQQSAGQYHALTAYNMTWQYTPIQSSDGTCGLTDVKIATNLSQYFPKAAASPAVWEPYITALHIHEEGHVQINSRYTSDMYAKLTGQQKVDCNSLPRVADEIVRTEMMLLTSAHELYDTQTGHGSTQGAVL